MSTKAPKLTKKEKQENLDNALEFLQKHIKEGSTVYTVLTNVSSSGMCRRFKVLIQIDNRIVNISGRVSTALGLRWHDEGSVAINGCGMDMGFALVNDLQYKLGKTKLHQEHLQKGDST